MAGLLSVLTLAIIFISNPAGFPDVIQKTIVPIAAGFAIWVSWTLGVSKKASLTATGVLVIYGAIAEWNLLTPKPGPMPLVSLTSSVVTLSAPNNDNLTAIMAYTKSDLAEGIICGWGGIDDIGDFKHYGSAYLLKAIKGSLAEARSVTETHSPHPEDCSWISVPTQQEKIPIFAPVMDANTLNGFVGDAGSKVFYFGFTVMDAYDHSRNYSYCQAARGLTTGNKKTSTIICNVPQNVKLDGN